MKSILEEISVLYENDDYVAINKPDGLVVHPDGTRDEPTVTDWVIQNYPKIENVGEPIVRDDGKTIYRPGIVHRLDRDTSGVLVIAKNQKAYDHLKNQFQNREVKKVYHSFVYGHLKDDNGIIDRPIGRSKNDFRKWTAQRGTRGELREAVTWYFVINRLETSEGKFTYVEVKPQTGRTHQIRVHFKAINYPVVADSLYAPNHPKALGFDRVALHSFSISFKGLDNKSVIVTAPLPKDFKRAIKAI